MRNKPSGLIFLLLLLSPSVFSYNLESFTDQIDLTYEVQTALLNAKLIGREILYLTHPEDVSFSLNPSVKSITSEGESFGEEIEISGSASAKIPMGLSSLEKERLIFAMDAKELAERAVQRARENVYITIYSLYQKLWLLQQEEKILETEVSVAENSLELLQQRFALGNVSLINLADADESLQEINNSLLQNQLEQRISWFELKSMTFLDMESEPGFLERVELNTEKIPNPPELYQWIRENNTDVINERMKLKQLEQTLKRLENPDFDFSVKSFFNSVENTFTASLNYNFFNPELTPALTFPIYTYGEIPSSGGSSTSTWNTGLIFNISIGSNRSDKLNGERLKIEIINERAKIDFLIESANLQLRSAYQQHLRDLDALEEAKRGLSRSLENQKIIETKKELGQISSSQFLESESIVERNLWKIEAARINVEKSWLTLVERAIWFKNTALKI
jgi:outer membrane protein TolC